MGSLCSSEILSDVVVDIEKSQPSEYDMKLYGEVDEVLQKAPRVLKTLEDYKGCQDLAKKAMSNPSRETELKAFEGLLGAVDDIATYYHYSQSLSGVTSKILESLASDDMKQSFARQAAVVRQLAEIFDFCLTFDQTRMMRPIIPNDYSYYRRLLPKFPEHPDIKLSEDEANMMAMFTAQHVPILTALTNATDSASKNNPKSLLVLSTFANSFMTMVKTKKFAKKETNALCVRAMTCAIVVFDHASELGAFHKNSGIEIRGAINVIKSSEIPGADSLLNALRYSSKHFNDDSTPANVKDLLEN